MLSNSFSLGNGGIKRIGQNDLKKVFNAKSAVWLDVEKSTKEDIELLQSVFPLHQLACDSVFDYHIHPVLQDYPDHLFMVFFEPVPQKQLAFSRLDIFLGKNFLITLRKEQSPAITSIISGIEKNSNHTISNPSFLLYEILDRIVDSHFPMLDDVNKATDSLESRVLLRNDKQLLDKVFSLKRHLFRAIKKISFERDMLSILSRTDSAFIDKKYLVFFRELHENMVRVHGFAEDIREVLSNILEMYVSTQSNRLNEVIKILTLLATILLPLTLITGFYGMNIVFPEVSFFGDNFYWAILTAMVLISLAFYYYFKSREWW